MLFTASLERQGWVGGVNKLKIRLSQLLTLGAAAGASVSTECKSGELLHTTPDYSKATTPPNSNSRALFASNLGFCQARLERLQYLLM